MTTTYKTSTFIAFLLVAFINAFVDLGHKIIIQNTVFKIYDDQQQVILTAIINGLILLPFIFSLSPAGFLSDRFAKPRIMQTSAVIAVVITLFITYCYYQGWFITALCMTFLLALQSAIYSPAKYGYIKELLGQNKLAYGNGLTQATSIVAILTGIIVFSIGFEHLLAGKTYHSEQDILPLIAPLGWSLVVLSLFELLLAFTLPNHASRRTPKDFNWRAYVSGTLFIKNLRQLRGTPSIWYAVLALSLFWGVSQTVLATFPAFAKAVLNETNTIVIQGLLACAGIGIIIGALIAGKLSNTLSRGLITTGALGLVATLLILTNLNDTSLFAITIIGFGLSGGLFIVPLNTHIQALSPAQSLGTILAGNNWVQNCVMLAFLILTLVCSVLAVSSAVILYFLPIFLTFLFIALLYKFKHLSD